jgi:hypothetical protein
VGFMNALRSCAGVPTVISMLLPKKSIKTRVSLSYQQGIKTDKHLVDRRRMYCCAQKLKEKVSKLTPFFN